MCLFLCDIQDNFNSQVNNDPCAKRALEVVVEVRKLADEAVLEVKAKKDKINFKFDISMLSFFGIKGEESSSG